MKKFTLIPFLLLAFLGFSQSQFVVQNGTAAVYSNINDALTAADNGDTIYVPGSSFALSNTTIDKTLHWIGTGHYPGYTNATGVSRITSDLTFTGNCDGSSFEGIYFTGDLNFGSSDNETENLLFKRCRIDGTLTLRTITSDNPDIGTYITECVLKNIDGQNGSNCVVEKSLIFGAIIDFYQSLFNHNSHTPSERGYYNRETISHCVSCTFTNNIFAAYSGLYDGTSSCVLNYNLFKGSSGSIADFSTERYDNTGSNNIFDVSEDEIFEKITGDMWIFSYDNDYHLKTGCPGIGAASDGTNIGIYGSSKPCKEGAVPFYPHITQFEIDNEAGNGQLGVSIKVEAQDH
ncbi:MAG: hypothetical protein R6V32_09280 [Bacteroidales bacterium]